MFKWSTTHCTETMYFRISVIVTISVDDITSVVCSLFRPVGDLH